MKVGLAIISLLVASLCGGGRDHSYALCDGRDANGWQLTSTEYDGDYLIACTYTKPDGRDSYEVRSGHALTSRS